MTCLLYTSVHKVSHIFNIRNLSPCKVSLRGSDKWQPHGDTSKLVMFPDLCSALYHFFLVLWQQCVALILKEINILLPGMLSFKQYALFTFSNSSQYYAALCLFFVKKIHIYNTSINHENIAAKIAASDFLPSLNLFHHFQTIAYSMT